MIALLVAAAVGLQAPATLAEPLTAVGRLNHAGYAKARHCTFVAVAPKVALTASHCIEGLPPEELHLLFGYARSAFVARLGVAASRAVGPDATALCLDEEAPATMAIGAPAKRGEEVAVIGYGRPRVHVQQRSACKVLTPVGPDLLLDCPASQGTSGGPVVGADGGVVGVVSRTGRGSSVAVAVGPEAVRACDVVAR